MSVNSDGILSWDNADNVQTSVGQAGSAEALPASPSKYLKIKADDGVVYLIPAFAQ